MSGEASSPPSLPTLTDTPSRHGREAFCLIWRSAARALSGPPHRKRGRNHEMVPTSCADRHTTLLPFRRYAKGDVVTHCDTRRYSEHGVRMPASKVPLWSQSRVKTRPSTCSPASFTSGFRSSMDTSEQVKGQNSFFGFTAGFCSHVGPPASKISWGVGRGRISTPISATTFWIVLESTPETASSFSYNSLSTKGTTNSSIRALSCAIC